MSIIPQVQPPFSTLGKKLESKMRKAFFDFNLHENPKIAIALSGGKDSLTLLYLLKALSGRGFPPFEILAIHITGAFTCGASIQPSFLEKICTDLNVKLVIKEQKHSSAPQSCYPCSRERRRLLFEAAKEKGYNTLAFGHHKDDFIQTLMMNLLHKGEFAANLAKIKMEHYGITIIRPLTYIDEKDILQFAIQNGYHRVVCRCPVGETSMRKKTSHLINYLEKHFPNTKTNLAQAAFMYGSQKAGRP